MPKDAYYFFHDSNARNDPKMLMLRARHGARGYGIYFMIVEMLREQSDYRFDAADMETLYPSIALGVGEPAELTKAVIDDCIKLKLLMLNGSLYSESLLRRMGRLGEIRAARAQAGRLGGMAKCDSLRRESSKSLANAKQMLSKPLANAKQTSSKSLALDLVEESRVEETKKTKTTEGAVRLTSRLVELMLQSDPGVKIPSSLTAWQQEADKLLGRDGRPLDESISVLEWAKANDFWNPNIMSMGKFREKYSTLLLQMRRNNGSSAGRSGHQRIVGGAAPVAGKYPEGKALGE